jgi:hypothetical protein
VVVEVLQPEPVSAEQPEAAETEEGGAQVPEAETYDLEDVEELEAVDEDIEELEAVNPNPSPPSDKNSESVSRKAAPPDS